MKMESEMSDGVHSSNQQIATLQARKDVLETKLHNKTQELKSLCIKEAELTGILPPEIPLEAGESPPPFRRRVGTAFTYPENLISNNSMKTKEEETLTALELEFRIQKDIADAALSMANDTALDKAVRRKHRQVYQKIQFRLMDLEKRLNILRQCHIHSNKPQHLKQRKKPRPPLDHDERDPILHDEGISLSPLGPAHQELEVEGGQHHWEIGACTYGNNAIHDASVIPPRFSSLYNELPRPVIQENKMMHHRYGSRSLYSAHPEMERRERLDQGLHVPGYWLRYETDRENFCYVTAPKINPTYSLHPQDMAEHRKATDTSHYTSTAADTILFHRERDRFGSLDRRKSRTTSHSNSNPCLEFWELEERNADSNYYPTTTYAQIGYEVKENSSSQGPYHPHVVTHNNAGGEGALLPSQTYPEHCLGMDSRGLIRTQSLGSMDSTVSMSPPCGPRTSDRRSIKDLQTLQPSDILSRKQKEKEWYETSLDCSPVSVPIQHPYSPCRPSEMKNVNCSDLPMLNQSNGAITPEILLINDQISDASSNLSRSSSNVSNDLRSHYLQLQTKSHEIGGNENFDTVVPFESPKNHMVIQAGKWQPYREVSKPFEMADFYKYSTKFRKNSVCPGNVQLSGQHSQPSSFTGLYPQANATSSVGSPTPQQKGIYQPLQPMTCQPVEPTSRDVVSPNITLGSRLLLGHDESLADAFSAEMLTWYQDQSVARSATLV